MPDFSSVCIITDDKKLANERAINLTVTLKRALVRLESEIGRATKEEILLQGKKRAFALKTKRRQPLKTRIIQSVRGSRLRTVMEIISVTVDVLHNNR